MMFSSRSIDCGFKPSRFRLSMYFLQSAFVTSSTQRSGTSSLQNPQELASLSFGCGGRCLQDQTRRLNPTLRIIDDLSSSDTVRVGQKICRRHPEFSRANTVSFCHACYSREARQVEISSLLLLITLISLDESRSYFRFECSAEVGGRSRLV
jgi:hypothetical protein